MATEYDTARQEFLALFPRRDAFIWKLFGYERWQKAKGPLLDAQIAGVISDDGRGLFRGCYWAHKTLHAVLDIDSNSRYHNAGELAELTKKSAAVGLKAKPYQSSDSGGWHLYLFFDDWADSDEVGQTLKRWLKSLGYEIASGTLEVFPSGNALRLPLQQGFGWLGPDGNLQLKRGEIQENKAIALFLEDLNTNSCNWQNAKALIDSQLQAAAASAGELAIEHTRAISNEGFEDLFSSGMILEKWQNGRDLWLSGLTEKDQRHEALLAVGHYLWYGDAEIGLPAHPGRFNDQARARLIRAWLETKHNGLSGHVTNNNWPAIEADIERAVSWRRLENPESTTQHIPYGQLKSEAAQDRIAMLSRTTGRTWTPEDWKKGNEKREKQARRKIKRAVDSMCSAGEQLTRNAIAQKSGCSPNTVSKHRDLWHLLASRSGDLSRGVLGGSGVLPGGFGSEKKELDRSSIADSMTFQLVAPLQICPATSQPSNSHSEDQALRVLLEVFTTGPKFDGIQAEGQMGTGGVSCIWEKLKTQQQHVSQRLPIRRRQEEQLEGNSQNTKQKSVFKIGKTLFILPYGSQRRPGSDLLPVRRMFWVRFGFAAAAGGFKFCLRSRYPSEDLNCSERNTELPLEQFLQRFYRGLTDAGG